MNNAIPTEMSELLQSLQGLQCWYVSSGGAAGSTFQMSLGEKIQRSVPLKNPAHSDDYRHFEGEVSLLVWCAWRLDTSDAPLTSWDDKEESVEAGLQHLVGARIESIEVTAPAWDLNIEFSDGQYLRIFCDHVPGDPSFDGNWDLRVRDVSLAVGPGAKYRIDDRSRLPQPT